ncbi:PRTRC system protein B [Thauera sp. 27]|uniref:PRTRC system protein B n=1 Tax=Thauera sp. 27 TaxID=305700 RepID=UPI0012F8878D|nr:PRTRC system protein B [Thauera sp. 27]
MSVTMNLSEQPYRAQHAVLLYGQHRPSYVSVHEVAEQHDGSLRIGVGTPATMSGLRELFDQLDPSRKVRPVFFEANVLSQGPGWLVWWMKPQTRRVWFDGSGFKDESAEVPHPGLVFAVSALGWQVFAVGGKGRPRPGTKLYQVPYFNVWEGGRICTGTARTPEGAKAQEPKAWEDAFFLSRFSHPNIHEANKLVKYRGGPVKFWKAMLKGKFKSFPTETLVETNWTVSNLLESIGRAR